MINLLGKHYAKDQKEAIRVLKEHGDAFAGFYREMQNGVLFLDRQRIPFAFAAMDPTNGGTFFVTAHRVESGTYEGRTRYMFGLGDYTARALGIESLKHSEQSDAAREVIRLADVPMYKRFYRVDEVTA